jgi:hypothetical protein
MLHILDPRRHNRSALLGRLLMADKQIIEKYLDVGYLQKKVQETSGADYRTKFEASFDSLDPSIQDSVKKALEYAHYLPDLQQHSTMPCLLSGRPRKPGKAILVILLIPGGRLS